MPRRRPGLSPVLRGNVKDLEPSWFYPTCPKAETLGLVPSRGHCPGQHLKCLPTGPDRADPGHGALAKGQVPSGRTTRHVRWAGWTFIRCARAVGQPSSTLSPAHWTPVLPAWSLGASAGQAGERRKCKDRMEGCGPSWCPSLTPHLTSVGLTNSLEASDPVRVAG